MTEKDHHRYAVKRTLQTFAIAALVCLVVLCWLSGCGPFTLSDINTGVTAGRTFEDGRVFDTGRTVWSANVSGHWVRREK